MTVSVLEEVINLEEGFYKNGFENGALDGIKRGKLEGRQFGLETSFDNGLFFGVINGLLDVWLITKGDIINGSDKIRKKMEHVVKLVSDIPRSNSDADVEQRIIKRKKLQANMKVIAGLLNVDYNEISGLLERNAVVQEEEF